MGAALGCDRSSDADLDQLCVHSRRPPLSVHSSFAAGASGKLPRELSFSWRTPASDPTHARAATDHENEESADWNLFRTSTKVHSSSRLLSEFYSLVLESDQNAFFMDPRGHRMSGSDAWMELHMIDLYFHDGSPQQPPMQILASLQKHMLAHDSFSNTSTSSTLYSESDYWPTVDSFKFSFTPSEDHAYIHHMSDHHLSLQEASLAGSPPESRVIQRTSHITKDLDMYAMWDAVQSEEDYDNIWMPTPKESDGMPVSPRSSLLPRPRSSFNATLAS